MANEETKEILEELTEANPKEVLSKVDEINQGGACVLMYLDENKDKEIISDNIAKELNMSNCRVSKLIKRLVSCKFIAKVTNPKDARASFVKLTKKGTEEVKNIKDKLLKMFENVIKDVGIDNIKEYIRISRMIKQSSLNYSL